MLILALGCSGSGGGSAGDGSDVVASTPVDLAPGQTTALLAWTPSVGDVSGYYVLESRNDSAFNFSNFSAAPEVEISGQPGDSVRIQVIALARTGTVSAPSTPSVPMRFHAAIEEEAGEAAAATTAAAALVSVAALATEPEAGSETDAQDGSEPVTGGDADSDAVSEAEAEATSAIDPVLREQLLGADVRFAFAEWPQGVTQWLQSQVDAQIGGGLSLVGTGDANGDAFSELIWADQSGQLFVSDGTALATAVDPTTALAETIRLRATERFAGLADFSGDGVADWLIEDSATREAWLVDGATLETTAVLAIEQEVGSDLGARLAGHGDFDGDGLSEFLWSYADGSFRLARGATSALEPIDWPLSIPFELETSQLLAVADLNGDGRDDLLFLGADGQLQSALSTEGLASVVLTSSSWSDRSTDGLELIATLDIDHDGRAEIAWHDGVDLVLWSASDDL